MKTLELGLTPKLSLVLVLFAAALLVGVGWFSYSNGRAALEAAAVSELLARAIEKEAALNAWVEDRRADVASFAASPLLLANVAALAGPERATAHEHLMTELRPRFTAGGAYLEFSVLAPETGEVIVSTDPLEEGKFKENRLYFLNGKTGPYVQNVYYSTATQGQAMTAAAPLRSAGGRLLGVLAARLNLEQMNAIVQRRTRLHQSDDAFLVNTSNLFVTQPRFVADPAVLQRDIHTEAVQRCLAGSSGTITAADYRNVPALIAYRWLPERQLCLVVKVDEAEAIAPVRAFGQTIGLIGGLGLLAASVLAVVLARTITIPLRQLLTAAQAIGSGQLDTRLEVKSGDELGELAGAFVQMAENLQQSLVSRADLLKEVAERQQAEVERERLLRILDASLNEVYVFSPDTLVFEYVNVGAQRNLDYTLEQLRSMTPLDLKPEFTETSFRQMIKPLQDHAEEVHLFETVHRRADGSLYPVEVHLQLIQQADEAVFLAVIFDITARKQAEEELRASEIRWRTLMQNLPAFIVEADVEGSILALNRTQPGFSLSDYVGKSLFEVVAPDSREQFKLAFAQALQEAAMVEYEAPGYGPNRQPAWYHRQLVPIVRDDAIRSILMVANDITARKQAEERLKQSEENYRGLIEQASDGIFIADPSGKYIEVNSSGCAMLGYTRDEILAKRIPDLLPPAELSAAPLRLDELRQGKIFLTERTLIRKNGTLLPVEISARMLPDGRFQAIQRDITERKRADEAMRQSENTLRAWLNAIQESALLMDRDGLVLAANATVAQRLQRPVEELVGGCIYDFIPPQLVPTRRSHVAQVLESGQSVRFEDERLGRVIDNLVYPVFDQAGQVKHLAILGTDITERRQTEQQLQRQRAILEALLNSPQETVALLDTAGQVLSINLNGAKRFGLAAEAMQGRNIYEFIAEPVSSERKRLIAEVMRSGQAAHFEDERQNSHYMNSVYAVSDPQSDELLGAAIFAVDITERKRAEEKIQNSEAFLNRLIEQSPLAMWIADEQGILLRLNQACCDLLHITPTEVVGRYNIFQDNLVATQGFLPLVKAVFERGETARFELNYDSSQIESLNLQRTVAVILDVTIFPIKDTRGQITHAVIQHHNITERKRAEEQLAYQANLLANIKDAVTAADERFILTAWNRAAEEMFGWKAEEVLGRSGQEVFRSEFIGVDRSEVYRRVMETGQFRGEMIQYRQDGVPIFVEANTFALRNEKGQTTGYVTISRDITERKRIEENIRQLNAELEQRVAERTAELSDLYNNAPCGYHSLDGDGLYVRINDTELNWLGYTREEIIGKMKAPNLMTPASVETFGQNFPLFKARGRLENLELDMVRKDGSILPVLLSATVIADQNGRYLLSRSTIIDHTERKRAETALRESQAKLETANKELEAFSYSVSHDLRAPLRGIDGWSLALLEDYAEQLDETARQYLDRVRVEAQRMGQLIDDLLQLSRVSRAEVQLHLVDLTGLAQTVVARLKEAQPERQVEVIIQPNLLAYGDAGLLGIVLTNLLGNAWKFSGARPQARIEFGRLLPSLDRPEAGDKGTVYFVRDNGAGFDMAYASKLFGAFQRMHKASEFPGTGIGLTIVQRIVHRHSGRVWAEAQVGQGATFYLTLEENPPSP